MFRRICIHKIGLEILILNLFNFENFFKIEIVVTDFTIFPNKVPRKQRSGLIGLK